MINMVKEDVQYAEQKLNGMRKDKNMKDYVIIQNVMKKLEKHMNLE